MGSARVRLRSKYGTNRPLAGDSLIAPLEVPLPMQSEIRGAVNPGAPRAAALLALFGDDRLDLGGRAAGHLDLDHEGADLADRLLQADLAPVDPQAARLLDRV